jgi:hypothetical protein
MDVLLWIPSPVIRVVECERSNTPAEKQAEVLPHLLGLALLRALRFRLRLGRLRPWPWHRGVGLNPRDQRDRFVSAEWDADVGCGLCHASSINHNATG